MYLIWFLALRVRLFMARELTLFILFISLMAIYEAIFLCTRPKMFLSMCFCSAECPVVYTDEK